MEGGVGAVGARKMGSCGFIFHFYFLYYSWRAVFYHFQVGSIVVTHSHIYTINGAQRPADPELPHCTPPPGAARLPGCALSPSPLVTLGLFSLSLSLYVYILKNKHFKNLCIYF